MLTANLKPEVQKALGVEWEAFRSRHPRLAEVIDQDLLLEQATACIADDAAFRAAIDQAAALGAAAGIIQEAVRKFVGDWMGKLWYL